MHNLFRKFANKTSAIVGSPWSFIIATGVVIVWFMTGPIFRYSDTWQLIINTATTVLTFLIVFLIQNTQNRDAKAIHIKLDELLKGVRGARNIMVNIEDVSDDELEKLHQEFQKLHEHYEKEVVRRNNKVTIKQTDKLELSKK